MIQKDGSDFVTFSKKETLGLAFEAQDRGFELVDRDTFSRSRHGLDFVLLCLGSPWSFSGSSV
jgi:hypothetical protein